MKNDGADHIKTTLVARVKEERSQLEEMKQELIHNHACAEQMTATEFARTEKFSQNLDESEEMWVTLVQGSSSYKRLQQALKL